VPPRPLAEIDAEIRVLEEEIQGLLRDVTALRDDRGVAATPWSVPGGRCTLQAASGRRACHWVG